MQYFAKFVNFEKIRLKLVKSSLHKQKNYIDYLFTYFLPFCLYYIELFLQFQNNFDDQDRKDNTELFDLALILYNNC